MANALRAGHDQIGGEADEEPVLDDAGAGSEPGGEGHRIRDGREGAVEDPVALVGLVRPAVAGEARAVGRALGANPIPLIIPCHRVVHASGGLRGFSAPGGTLTKGKLLALEGVGLPLEWA